MTYNKLVNRRSEEYKKRRVIQLMVIRRRNRWRKQSVPCNNNPGRILSTLYTTHYGACIAADSCYTMERDLCPCPLKQCLRIDSVPATERPRQSCWAGHLLAWQGPAAAAAEPSEIRGTLLSTLSPSFTLISFRIIARQNPIVSMSFSS